MRYTIGEMAKLLGVSASALRYYDTEGLLPFVERTPGGARIFHDTDYEWLQIIRCLKKTGMPLTEIRAYLHMTMEGDKTIESRLSLLQKQRQDVLDQMAALRQTLEILDYKCWYYETAKEAGTTNVPRNMPLEEVPAQYHRAIGRLRSLPEKDA